MCIEFAMHKSTYQLSEMLKDTWRQNWTLSISYGSSRMQGNSYRELWKLSGTNRDWNTAKCIERAWNARPYILFGTLLVVYQLSGIIGFSYRIFETESAMLVIVV